MRALRALLAVPATVRLLLQAVLNLANYALDSGHPEQRALLVRHLRGRVVSLLMTTNDHSVAVMATDIFSVITKLAPNEWPCRAAARQPTGEELVLRGVELMKRGWDCGNSVVVAVFFRTDLGGLLDPPHALVHALVHAGGHWLWLGHAVKMPPDVLQVIMTCNRVSVPDLMQLAILAGTELRLGPYTGLMAALVALGSWKAGDALRAAHRARWPRDADTADEEATGAALPAASNTYTPWQLTGLEMAASAGKIKN